MYIHNLGKCIMCAYCPKLLYQTLKHNEVEVSKKHDLHFYPLTVYKLVFR